MRPSPSILEGVKEVESSKQGCNVGCRMRVDERGH